MQFSWWMLRRQKLVVLGSFLLIFLIRMSGNSACGQDKIEVTNKQLSRFQNAPIVMVGVLEKVESRGAKFSNPPVWMHELVVDVESVVKGRMKTEAPVRLHHSARQRNAPSFPVGKSTIFYVSPAHDGGFWVIDFERGTPEGLALLKSLRRVPTGWSLNAERRAVSPWPHQKGTDWSKLSPAEDAVRCVTTGRPGTLLPEELTFAVEKVAPVKEVKWSNPDGDGNYTVTLSNPTDKPVTVNSLFSDGEKILWDQSLLIRCQGKTYPLCLADSKMPKSVLPVTLQPGQSISTEIHTLLLNGPEWPRGGYRIKFQFVLAQTCVVKSLYYNSDHHDPIRKQLNKGKKKRGKEPGHWQRAPKSKRNR